MHPAHEAPPRGVPHVLPCARVGACGWWEVCLRARVHLCGEGGTSMSGTSSMSSASLGPADPAFAATPFACEALFVFARCAPVDADAPFDL